MSVERIGRGPWARLVATSVVPDEGSSVAERGRRLAGSVENLEVERGLVTGSIEGERASIAARPVPARIWAAVVRSARGMDAALEGRDQSVRLEHVMATDWEEPLVPRTRSLTTEGTAEHVAALAFAFASAIDRDPALLLRWRGCVEVDAAPAEETTPPLGAWSAGPLPPAREPRPLPAGSVLKRLGRSDVRVAGTDLEHVLEQAYRVLQES